MRQIVQIGIPDTPNIGHWYIWHAQSRKLVHLVHFSRQIVQKSTSGTLHPANWYMWHPRSYKLVHLVHQIVQIGQFSTPVSCNWVHPTRPILQSSTSCTPHPANWYIWHPKSYKLVPLVRQIMQIGLFPAPKSCQLVHLTCRILESGTPGTPNMEIGTPGTPERANWYTWLTKSFKLVHLAVHLARQIVQIGTSGTPNRANWYI